jgi:hypothetical protein
VGNLNTKLVDSLDLLNHILAIIFAILAVVRFVDVVGDNILGAILESLTVVGVGVLTCGYIALMININKNLDAIRNRLEK